MTVKWTWRKGLLLSFLFAVGIACFWLAVSPTHWLRKVDFGTVQVDEHQVDADIFFGNPEGEAEAIVLVHLRDGSDYFLDFGSERVRPGSASEYVRLFGGVWCFRSMQKGSFGEPLPFRRLNEFRIPTQGGHVVSVQF
jgi:hypothetical protein